MSASPLRRLLVGLTLAAVATPLTGGIVAADAASATRSAPSQSCRYDDPFLTNLRAQNTSCKVATKVADTWRRKAVQGDSGMVRRRTEAEGFTCLYKNGKARCTKRAATVTFTYGF